MVIASNCLLPSRERLRVGHDGRRGDPLHALLMLDVAHSVFELAPLLSANHGDSSPLFQCSTCSTSRHIAPIAYHSLCPSDCTSNCSQEHWNKWNTSLTFRGFRHSPTP